jgi:hypothetical protein
MSASAGSADLFAVISGSHLKPEFLHDIMKHLSLPGVPQFIIVALLTLIAKVDQSQFFMGDWHVRDHERGDARLLSLALFCVETLTSMIENGWKGEPNRFFLLVLEAYGEFQSCGRSDAERSAFLEKWRQMFQSTYDGMDPCDSNKNDWDIHIRNLSNFFGRNIPTNPFQASNPEDAFWLIDLAHILSQDGFAIAKMAEANSWRVLQDRMTTYMETRPCRVFLEQFKGLLEKTGPKRASSDFDDGSDDGFDDDTDHGFNEGDDYSSDSSEEFMSLFAGIMMSRVNSKR